MIAILLAENTSSNPINASIDLPFFSLQLGEDHSASLKACKEEFNALQLAKATKDGELLFITKEKIKLENELEQCSSNKTELNRKIETLRDVLSDLNVTLAKTDQKLVAARERFALIPDMSAKEDSVKEKCGTDVGCYILSKLSQLVN